MYIFFFKKEMHRRLLSVVLRCAWKKRTLYRRPLAGNPIRYVAQVVGVNKIKSFMKIICKKGVSLKTLLTTVASVLVSVSCTALGWMNRLLWRERVIHVGQSGRSESANDLVQKYMKMWVKFWILPRRKYRKQKSQRPVEKIHTSKKLCVLKLRRNKIGIHRKSWEKDHDRLDQPWF